MAQLTAMRMPLMVIDVAALQEPGHDRGLGRYTRTLQGVAADLSGYRIIEYSGRSGPRHRFSEWLDIPHRGRFLAGKRSYYHATSAYHLAPTHLRRTVVSIQDLIPLELGTYTQTGLKARVFFSWARRCPVVITSSSYSARRIETLLAYPRERIVVSPLPVADVAEDAERGRHQLLDRPETYVASLVDAGDRDPRKRLPWLLGAAAHLERHGLPLVLVGSGTAELRSRNVVGLGRLCDGNLRQVLAGARCFMYASAYEGQGLPPQEALAQGTPVVAFRNTSLPEMLGPGALWLEEPAASWRTLGDERQGDPQAAALGEGALSLHNNDVLHRELARAGREHVASFTLERFAAGVRAAYELLTGERPGAPSAGAGSSEPPRRGP